MIELKIIEEESWKEGQGKGYQVLHLSQPKVADVAQKSIQVGSLSVLFQGELMLTSNSESGSANKLNSSYLVADA